MLKLFLLCLLLTEKACCLLQHDNFPNNTKRQFIYKTYKYDSLINIVVNDTTEHILDFYEDSNDWMGYPTRVNISSSNNTIDSNYPLFITATQQKSVSSWELPLVIQTRPVLRFYDMARTLCPHDAGPNITRINSPLLQVTTTSPVNVSVKIELNRVTDFYVEVDKEIYMNVTPSTPKYYYFSFDSKPLNKTSRPHVNMQQGVLPRFNYTIPKSVILQIDSEDDLCAIVSIQNNSCPVFDNEQDMLYQGYHLTMTRKGGITLTQTMFPLGFYIVFIVKENDEECSDKKNKMPRDWNELEGIGLSNRSKEFRFKVVATISYEEFVVGATVLLAVTLLVATLALLLMVPSICHWKEQIVVEDVNPNEASTSRDTVIEEAAPIVVNPRSKEDSPPESECDPAEFASRVNTLAGLSRAPSRAHSRRSDRYFWSALTVAVVYALPVVQLLFTYQQMVFQTGNQDLCYYNFLCAHPLGFLSDFNHVYSNMGYVLLGLIFMAQTRYRQITTRNKPEGLGIPHHHGLFYSMGLALVMEGILSACYHLCPNKMNFQFDSSFMYVIAVLCMVKLYQNRHPDVNASAHSTFMLLAIIIAIGLFGIINPAIWFWAVFTVLHLLTCLTLTLKIYYFNNFKVEYSVFGRAYGRLRDRGLRALIPGYQARAILLAIANLANWALAIYGLSNHNQDFAKHLLEILMGNTILYTLFYFAMKVVYREPIPRYTWLYFVGAHVAWATALAFFLDSKTMWSRTPAGSRRLNAKCSTLQFYDSHDLWHVASAVALFFSFNMLLTVDDALATTPHCRIPVF